MSTSTFVKLHNVISRSSLLDQQQGRRVLPDLQPDLEINPPRTNGYQRIDDEDICLWADGTFCLHEELDGYDHMSDDYRIIPFNDPEAAVYQN